jgi:hypothetical protein
MSSGALFIQLPPTKKLPELSMITSERKVTSPTTVIVAPSMIVIEDPLLIRFCENSNWLKSKKKTNRYKKTGFFIGLNF